MKSLCTCGFLSTDKRVNPRWHLPSCPHYAGPDCYVNVYKQLVDAGCKVDIGKDARDLHVLGTTEACAIVHASGWTYSTFRSARKNELWLEVPFAAPPVDNENTF